MLLPVIYDNFATQDRKTMIHLLSHTEDTIAALATPAGVGAISVVRVSGPESIKLVDNIFSGKKKLIKVLHIQFIMEKYLVKRMK